MIPSCVSLISPHASGGKFLDELFTEMSTPDQNAALQDALARAKQIAAKLQQQGATGGLGATSHDLQDDSRKRPMVDMGAYNGEPFSKRPAVEDPSDPKLLALQVAQNLVTRAGLGSMAVEEIQIPNKFVGLIIGRGGEMINKLQSESGARIQVAPDPLPDKVHEDRNITITGTTEAVGSAKDLISKIVTEGKVPDHLILSAVAPGEFVIEYMVPSNRVGLVIGKGGETIRSLQERAGCKMVLIQDGQYANLPEKPLRITGEPQKCAYGKQLVIDLLTEKELETMAPDQKHNPDGTVTMDYHVQREAVGFVIGRSGESIKKIQDSTGCRVQFKNDMGGPTKIAVLTGSEEAVRKAGEMIEEFVESGSQLRGYAYKPKGGVELAPPRPVTGSWGPLRQSIPAWSGQQGGQAGAGAPGAWGPHTGLPGPGGPGSWGATRLPRPFGGGAGGPPQAQLLPGQKFMEIQVPRNKAGLVIGKGGETLKYIHGETQVTIEINRTVPESAPFRVFTLQGTEEQIKEAEKIIQDKTGEPTATARPVGGAPGVPGIPGYGGPQQSPNQWAGPGAPPGSSQWAGPQTQPSWAGPGVPGPQPAGVWGPQQAAWGQPAAVAWAQPQQPWQQPGGAASAWNQVQQPGQPWQQPQAQWGAQPWSGAPQQAPQQADVAAQQQALSGQQAVTDPNQQQAAGGQQPDYSAAWAAYYQQYYQQFGMQPPASAVPAVAATGASVASTGAAATPTPAQTTAASQPDYSAQWAQYYATYYPGYQPTAAAAPTQGQGQASQ